MAVRLDVIVTRGGDGGMTSLGDGKRAYKDSARIEAIGEVDEANAAVGLLRSVMDHSDLEGETLEWIQHTLFDVGADLCLPSGPPTVKLQAVPAKVLEERISRLLERQDPLTSFVLPGGTPAAAQAHMARTIVRRAERRVVRLKDANNAAHTNVVKFLNRLSDYLFVLARHLNADGKADVLWQKQSKVA